MSEDTLDEYVKITKTIDNIHDKINKYKMNVLDSLKHSSSDKEQQDKMKDFQDIIKKIKSDPLITNKYRALKKSQDELKKKLISSSDFDNSNNSNTNINKQLSELKVKYDMLSKKRIIIIDDTKLSDIRINNGTNLKNEKFNSILDEVQLNLIKNDILNP